MSFKTIKTEDELDNIVSSYVALRQNLKQRADNYKVGIEEEKKSIDKQQKAILEAIQGKPVREYDSSGQLLLTYPEGLRLTMGKIGDELIAQGVSQKQTQLLLEGIAANSQTTGDVLRKLPEQLRLQGADIGEISKFLTILAPQEEIRKNREFMLQGVRENYLSEEKKYLDLIENKKKAIAKLKKTQSPDVVKPIRKAEKELGNLLKEYQLNTGYVDIIEDILDADDEITISNAFPKISDEQAYARGSRKVIDVIESIPVSKKLKQKYSEQSEESSYDPFEEIEEPSPAPKERKITVTTIAPKLTMKTVPEGEKYSVGNSVRSVLIATPGTGPNAHVETIYQLYGKRGKLLSEKVPITSSSAVIDFIKGEQTMTRFNNLKDEGDRKRIIEVYKSMSPNNRPDFIPTDIWSKVVGYGLGRKLKMGDVDIDLSKLRAGKLVVKRGDTLLIDEKADADTIYLLTKRYNPKKQYSKKSIKLFRKLVKVSGVDISNRSGKYSLLDTKYQTEPPMYINKGGKMVLNIGGTPMTPDDDIDRMGLIISSIEAGNDSDELKNELSMILDRLLMNNIITKSEHKTLFKDFIEF